MSIAPSPDALARDICNRLRAAQSLDELARIWFDTRHERRTVAAANPAMRQGFSNVSKARAAEITGEVKTTGQETAP